MWEELDAATRHLPAPLAAVHLDALRRNADDLVRRAAGTPVRVATKSVRCRAVLELVLARPGFRGLMAYSLREALWLVGHGHDDVLVAYPSVDRGALRDLVADERALAAVTVMVDDPVHLDLLEEAAAATRPAAPVRVCLDVDASLRVAGAHLGVRRSPLRTADQAAAAAREVARRPATRLVGVMTYDAQVAGLPDRSPAVRAVKRLSLRDLHRRRLDVVHAVERAAGGPLDVVNAGGTGSVELVAGEPAVTEVAAGSGLYGPTLFDAYRRFTPRPALGFGLDVTRRPAPRVRTLFAGGWVASGPAGEDRLPRPVHPPGLSLLGTEGAGEVQTPVRARGRVPEVGERVWLRHAKAGEVCERVSALHLVEGAGAAVRTVPTYRGEGRCFG
ncbi:alanine racemase [Thalassiella azotivora]